MSRHGTQDQEQRPETNLLQVTPVHVPLQLGPSLSDTLPRTLGGVNLEPKEIDEIFQLSVSSLFPFVHVNADGNTGTSYTTLSTFRFWILKLPQIRAMINHPSSFGQSSVPAQDDM
jgi:hypothetical protein